MRGEILMQQSTYSHYSFVIITLKASDVLQFVHQHYSKLVSSTPKKYSSLEV